MSGQLIGLIVFIAGMLEIGFTSIWKAYDVMTPRTSLFIGLIGMITGTIIFLLNYYWLETRT